MTTVQPSVMVAAAQALEKYASAKVQRVDRRLSSLLSVSLNHFISSSMDSYQTTKTPNWMNMIKVEKFENPRSWRLVHKDDDGLKEEIVFSVQGIITDKSLPPLSEKPR